MSNPPKPLTLQGDQMERTARDVMETALHTLSPKTSIADAVKAFKVASEEQRRKVLGMMVTNEQDQLVGMLSMYDILLLMRPKHIHIWGEMNDIDVNGFIDEACSRIRSILVGDIMATDVITITPDTHVLMIVDIMLKKHIRRIPVLENDKVVGIVHMPQVFYRLLGRLAD